MGQWVGSGHITKYQINLDLIKIIQFCLNIYDLLDILDILLKPPVFYHPLGWFQNSETCTIRKSGTGATVSTSSVFTCTRIPLFDLYTTTNDKSWCEVQNALKAV